MSNTRCDNHEKCISTTIDQVEKICTEKGLRFTKIRKAILEIIWESHQPIKAYDILSKISNINYSEKPPTVYRALDFLMENGFVHKINSLNSEFTAKNNSIPVEPEIAENQSFNTTQCEAFTTSADNGLYL